MNVEAIRRRVGAHTPRLRTIPDEPRRRASVALVFGGPRSGPSLLFIRRAERRGDPWSGQMAFPGGRASVSDASARAVAERETHEEVGLALDESSYFGRLDDVRLRFDGGTVRGGVLSSFCYDVGETLPTLDPHLREVAAAHWIAVAWLVDPRHRTTLRWPTRAGPLRLGAIAFEDAAIWGLTRDLLGKLGAVTRLEFGLRRRPW